MGAAFLTSTKTPPGYGPAADARFARLIAVELGIEGGFSDQRGDRGGATNFGVTVRFLQAGGQIDPALAARFDLDHDGDLDFADVRQLTPELAEDLYRRLLWIRTDFWQAPPPIDGMLLDQAINCGAAFAIRLLQRAINTLSQARITEDGLLGDQTMIAARILARTAPDRLVAAYRQGAMDHYRAIAKADPQQLRFLAGWLNRAEALGNV